MCIGIFQCGAMASGEVAFPTGQREVIQAAAEGTEPQGCSDSGSPPQDGTGLALTPSLSPHPPSSAKAVRVPVV